MWGDRGLMLGWEEVFLGGEFGEELAAEGDAGDRNGDDDEEEDQGFDV